MEKPTSFGIRLFAFSLAAPNQRIGALTKESDKQRFNVAASRARDQVWLFHTATRNDLNPDCMRHKLLAYYSNPAAQPVGKPDWEKCESDFERDVGKIIYAKNFRLIPQYEPFGPGSYRIDFVIEGLKSRLAVECDGPHHDDPEQIERDMARQRQLERCKWVFWRVSASSFYFEREKAMDSLWRKLEELEIHPLTAAQQEAAPETPPQVERPSLPKAAAPRSVAARSLQLDLVSPSQLELAAQKQMPSKALVDASKERLAAALTYAMVSQPDDRGGDRAFAG